LILLGDPSSGKSSLLLRFVDDAFSPIPLESTGVDFKIKTISLRGRPLKLQIFDFLGASDVVIPARDFRTPPQGVFIVYDVTQQSSFDNVKKWLKEVDGRFGSRVPTVLVGTKIDRAADRCIPSTVGANFALSWDLPFIETSAKDATNVEEAFLMLTSAIMTAAERPSEGNEPASRRRP
jgi:Ras-related protein Rab-1A